MLAYTFLREEDRTGHFEFDKEGCDNKYWEEQNQSNKGCNQIKESFE